MNCLGIGLALAPRVLLALLCISASLLQLEDGDAWKIMMLLTFRDPKHSWNAKQLSFLPLKEGKGHPKCHILRLLAQCWWKLSPKANLSSPLSTGLEPLSPFGCSHHLERSAARRLLTTVAEHSRDTCCVLPQSWGLEEGVSYYLEPQDKDSEVRKGCWLYINFTIRSTDFKSCHMAQNLFVL